MTLDDTKTVITPEQVAITYRLAGIGTRFAAVLLDTIIHVALLVGLVFVSSVILPGVDELLSWFEWDASPWMIALLIVLVFGMLWGYFIFWETVWSGRTPGKKLAGIRVMRDTGHPVDFRAAFLRNICRYVDFLPGGYGVGALAMFLSPDSKRLGDYVAGTIVVVDAQPAPKAGDTDAPRLDGYPRLGDPAMLNLRAVTRDQLLVIDRFLARRGDLSQEARAQLAMQIAGPLMALLEVEADSQDYPHEEFLEQLAAACRRRDRGSVPPTKGAGPRA
jgi:uncharacterized RDD family membrane protein YckC